MNTPQFEAFVNHWSSCQKCHPMHNIYCIRGRNLWIDNQAAFIANLPTLAERQHWMGIIAEQAPQYIVRIKQRVKELFEAK